PYTHLLINTNSGHYDTINIGNSSITGMTNVTVVTGAGNDTVNVSGDNDSGGSYVTVDFGPGSATSGNGLGNALNICKAQGADDFDGGAATVVLVHDAGNSV